jgi:hypothetical protein
MSRDYEGRLGKMKFLSLGPSHIDRNCAWLIVFADNLKTGMLTLRRL